MEFLVFRRVSSLPELSIVNIEAPESTKNSGSSGLFEEGAGITHASVASRTDVHTFA